MKPAGMKTAARISAMPITGRRDLIHRLDGGVAWREPVLDVDSTASTTTMASSTTRPIASTRPSSESVLIEKPSIGKTRKAPISETGTAISGIRVARQPCRKRKTTRITSTIASKSVCTISVMPSLTGSVVSSAIAYSRPVGKRSASSCIRCLSASPVASAFEPGDW